MSLTASSFNSIDSEALRENEVAFIARNDRSETLAFA